MRTSSALRSLTARLVLAMTLVAAVATGTTGVLVTPLLRGTVEDSVRSPLARQADLLARFPARPLRAPRVDRRLAAQDLAFGAVSTDGVRSGAAIALTDDEVASLLSGTSVSASGNLDGQPVVLEGRPSRQGGGVVLAAPVAAVDAAVGDLRRRILLALLLGLGLALVAAVLVSGRIGRPLARSAEAARRMAAGERGLALPEAGTREVEDLVQALGSLDRALSTSESRQRQFLLSVSHELRTPLTAVRGLAEGLADGTIPAEEARSVGQTLSAESQRLEHYVADLLALARLEADDFAFDLGPVDLAALLAEAGAAWTERARRHELDLRVSQADPGPRWVETDGSRLRQALDALIDNAVRVCPEGSVIVLARSTEGDVEVLEVRDSGPGLTEDDARHAFEPGFLHDRYAGVRPGGQGLGLALMHRLVTRLGGTVEVGPAPEGGTAFRIRVPRRARPVTPAG